MPLGNLGMARAIEFQIGVALIFFGTTANFLLLGVY